ncbi:terminase ATPase subunit family protein [Burkholderia plantarii]|uniref:terminase ATPase subunit family protein n=1 Tax=Burkholderia plantarii TaxID=41899 RepID=UPI00272CBA94|nr:terminase ATPase subunit family protein [Burkholderia plantarii]WLE59266.1 terminase ATPase subunit family protein [Burkholderia plantarii]
MIETAELNDTDIEPRRIARDLYWKGWRISSIARHLAQSRSTVESWKQRDAWDKATPVERVESALEARMMMLIAKPVKDPVDFKEIDLLGREMERMHRCRKYSETGKESDLNPAIQSRNAGPKKRQPKNNITAEQAAKLHDAFLESQFDYQKVWYRNGDNRTRNLLKSRQIGATFYFAREALDDALQTGRNQIFLSASKAQVHVFRQYICAFAREVIEVELTGDTILLPTGAELIFLSTNSKTAQSYHGNFYFDEYFWVHGFKTLNKVASGMAMHKHWRKTYFSTPSSVTHEAYSFWTGTHYNRGRAKSDHINVDTSHAALSAGRICEDRQWRQIVTVEDALAGGCNLFDIDELRLEYSADEFANLLLCQFIDDSLSVFPFAELQRCMIDSWDLWDDVQFLTLRPFGYRPVWLGYDPSLTGDSAGCVVLAPPAVPGSKFRVLEALQWHRMDFEAQAEGIRQLTERYHITYMAIDTTGMGQGVYQLVKQFFPAAVPLNYSPEVKSRLVLKGQSVISKGRLEWDAGRTDIAAAFMAIKKTLTASGRQITYHADRNDEIGHADLAWACLHALGNEPLEGTTANNTGFMELS